MKTNYPSSVSTAVQAALTWDYAEDGVQKELDGLIAAGYHGSVVTAVLDVLDETDSLSIKHKCLDILYFVVSGQGFVLCPEKMDYSLLQGSRSDQTVADSHLTRLLEFGLREQDLELLANLVSLLDSLPTSVHYSHSQRKLLSWICAPAKTKNHPDITDRCDRLRGRLGF